MEPLALNLPSPKRHHVTALRIQVLHFLAAFFNNLRDSFPHPQIERFS